MRLSGEVAALYGADGFLEAARAEVDAVADVDWRRGEAWQQLDGDVAA